MTKKIDKPEEPPEPLPKGRRPPPKRPRITARGTHDNPEPKNKNLKRIYFKLPLRQTMYHWYFRDRKAFLSGELTLRISNDKGAQELIVFKNGKLAKDWTEIGNKRKQRMSDEIYFGFASARKFSINGSENVEIVLRALKDINGIGPDRKGVLNAGEYSTRTKFTLYNTDDEFAFCGDKKCDPLWDLQITENLGYMAEKAGITEGSARKTDPSPFVHTILGLEVLVMSERLKAPPASPDHPLRGGYDAVKRALQEPDEIYTLESKYKINEFHFYKWFGEKPWVFVVQEVRKDSGLLTAVKPGDASKQGHKVWPR
jgi:hypothetical protein